jgi:hypothetical protein
MTTRISKSIEETSSQPSDRSRHYGEEEVEHIVADEVGSGE